MEEHGLDAKYVSEYLLMTVNDIAKRAHPDLLTFTVDLRITGFLAVPGSVSAFALGDVPVSGTQETRYCKWCGAPLTDANDPASCPARCMHGEDPKERQCLWCGTPLHDRSGAEFCGPACSDQYTRNMNAALGRKEDTDA